MLLRRRPDSYDCAVHPAYITNWTTPWSRALLEKPSLSQLLKNFPTFYGTQRFITVFTWVLHQSLLNQITASCLRSILILSSHLRIGLPDVIFPPGFHTKILYAFFFAPIRATRLLDMIILIMLGEEYMLWSSLCSFPRSLLSPLPSSVQLFSLSISWIFAISFN
jgi:hypothetical protein